ncbi:MAG: hypothetical protein FJ137_16735 [Deltaproteobacteria bacterium]|nr:hypothetical protein [Deltaproteobacteria bacterium]
MSFHRSLTLWAATAALGSACADEPLVSFCTDDGSGFYIEDVSVLQSNLGWQGTADAVVLSYEDARLAEDDRSSWRVTGIDVLVMIPLSGFDTYRDDAVLEVQLFDGDDLNATTPYKRRQTLVARPLQWSTHTFDTPPEGAREVDGFGLPVQNFEVDYVRAWWHFDFSDVIPEEGLTSTDYAVGLYWPEGPAPLVGYSFYDRPCADNWTNYDEADPPYVGESTSGWSSNGARNLNNECNWPMVKVYTELRSACQK